MNYLVNIAGWALLLFWLWMLLDCIRNEEDRDERLGWACVLLILNVMIAPIYFGVRFRRRRYGKAALKK